MNKNPKLKDSLVTMPDVGECQIDIDVAVKAWDHRTSISVYKNTFKLCHANLRARNFTKTDLKVTISKDQADQLINRLGLSYQDSPILINAGTWRRPQDIQDL